MSITEHPVEVDPLELIPTLPEEPLSRPEVLRAAASLIEKHGRIRHVLGHPSKGFCFLGAVSYAAGIWDASTSGFDPVQGERTVELIIGGRGDVTGIDITTWHDEMNDGPWGHIRTLAALRRLADGKSWEEATA